MNQLRSSSPGLRPLGGAAGLAATAAMAVALLAAASLPAGAAIPRPEKAKLALQIDHPACAAGETARISALVAIESGWHVNSHTPTFDYLIATELELELPAGWARASVDYPPGKKKSFAFADVPLSVYDGDVVIAAQVKVPADARPGAFPIRARLHYQACDHSQCLPPVTTQSQLTLTVVQAKRGGSSAVTPGAAAGPASAGGIAGKGGLAGAAAAGTPGAADAVSAPAPLPGHTPADFTATSSGTSPSAAAPIAHPAPRPGSLAAMLLIAVLGGLILNAMPCVLPVVSLKVFGLVQSAAHGRRDAVVRGALAIAAGILVSFAALAALAVAAAAAGAAVGWGTQFQRPGFVAFLAVVVTLFCLNLWGLFEIPMPRVLGHLGSTAAREGVAGHFVSGLFATLMATPCSAPFLGTAIGFGLAQPPPIVFAIFLATGTGLALPYLVLAAAPGAIRFLPRPGAWMNTLRGIMGFILGASAVWLLYVLAAQISPERLALFEVGLLLIALVTWLRHRAASDRAASRGDAGGSLATLAPLVLLLVVAAGAVALAASGAGDAGGSRLAAQGRPAGLIGWVAFDRARAESLAAGGQLVFVDVTADWCFTCKVNERLILDTPEIASAFATHHVLPMRADWTNRNDTITRFLADNGRYGIPFYLLYRPGREPLVFSELPTKSAILAALEAAAAPGAQADKL